MAILLLLAIPLNINNAFRIYRNYNARINYQVIPRLEIIEDFQNQVKLANSPENLANIIQQKVSTTVELPPSLDLAEFKDNIANNLQQESESLQSKAQDKRINRRKQLIRNVIKYNLGALIAIFLLIFVWQNTYWARTDYSWD